MSDHRFSSVVRPRLGAAWGCVAMILATIMFGGVSRIEASSGASYWMKPAGNSYVLTESVRSLLVSDGKLFFSASDIGGNGNLPTSSGSSFFGVGSYDGTTWSDVGGSIASVSGCGVYPDRPFITSLTGTSTNLYAGGDFNRIGGVSASLIARYNGTSWSALGDGLCTADLGGGYHTIKTLLVGTDLYVTGTFLTANGSSTRVNGIAKWDGTTWSALGGGMSASTHYKYGNALAWDSTNSVLYVGGAFDALNASYDATSGFGGAVSDTAGLACWNPSTNTWSSINASLATSNTVNALTYSGGVLYVGGDFTSIGGVESQFIAKFTPSGGCTGTWSNVGTGGLSAAVMTSTGGTCKTSSSTEGVSATLVDSGVLYVGCQVDYASQGSRVQVMKWNGSAWSSITSNPDGGPSDAVRRGVSTPRTLAVFGGKLWVGGNYSVSESGSSGLAKWGENLDPLIPTFSSSTTKTNASEFTFTVTFDTAVSGVESSDFTNSGTLGSCSTTNVVSTSSTVYTLTMSACSASEGTVIPVFRSGGATAVSGGTTGPNAAATSTATITRDTTAPTVSSVSSSKDNGSYKSGVEIQIQVNFSESVTVTGTPQITLETGTTDRSVSYISGSGSSTLVFSYTIQAGDTSSDLDYVATTSLSLNGGTIADSAGNAATLTLASPGATNSLGANKAIVVDTTVPVAIGVPNLEAASDLGASSTDDITSDNTPTFTVVVTAREGTATGYVRATKSGSSDVTCTLNVGGTCTLGTLADGTWSIVAFQTDLAGNDSANSTALSVTIDATAPTTVTLARSAATSTDSTITFTVTGTEALDCTTLSTTAGTDFTLTSGITNITSITTTSSTVCTVTAKSTATAGNGAVTSTLTAAGSFSIADTAGSTKSTLTGSPQTITVTVAPWTVTYNARSGSSVNSGTANFGGSISAPAEPSRTGYTFAGWSTSESGTAVSFPYAHGKDEDFTLYAQWTANTLTVTTDEQGGSAVVNASTKTDQAMSAPGSPTRAGYSFAGWFAAISGGSAISFPYAHGRTADFTLFAQWTVVPTTTTVAPTTTVPTSPRVTIPGVAAPRRVTVLAPTVAPAATKLVSDAVGDFIDEGDRATAAKVRAAVAAAAPGVGNAIADATLQLINVLKREEEGKVTKLEVTLAKSAVADAASLTILTALEAAKGNTTSLALPITDSRKLPEVAPGKVKIISPEGVQPAQIRIIDNSTVVLTSRRDGFSLAMTALESTGTAAPISSNGAVQAAPGQALAVTGNGFQPNSRVKVWMFSSPRSFGYVKTDARGSFAAEVPMPDNIPPGDHTAQVNGTSAGGGLRSLNLGVEVALEEVLSKPVEKPEVTPNKVTTPLRRFTLTSRIQFNPNSASLSAASRARLMKIARLTKGATNTSVRCVGFTQEGDTSGRYVLAKSRAKSVCGRLRRMGVDARFVPVGLGRAPKALGPGARHVMVYVQYETTQPKAPPPKTKKKTHRSAR